MKSYCGGMDKNTKIIIIVLGIVALLGYFGCGYVIFGLQHELKTEKLAHTKSKETVQQMAIIIAAHEKLIASYEKAEKERKEREEFNKSLVTATVQSGDAPVSLFKRLVADNPQCTANFKELKSAAKARKIAEAFGYIADNKEIRFKHAAVGHLAIKLECTNEGLVANEYARGENINNGHELLRTIEFGKKEIHLNKPNRYEYVYNPQTAKLAETENQPAGKIETKQQQIKELTFSSAQGNADKIENAENNSNSDSGTVNIYGLSDKELGISPETQVYTGNKSPGLSDEEAAEMIRKAMQEMADQETRNSNFEQKDP